MLYRKRGRAPTDGGSKLVNSAFEQGDELQGQWPGEFTDAQIAARFQNGRIKRRAGSLRRSGYLTNAKMWTASVGKLKSIAVCGCSWTISIDFDGGADGNEKNQSRQVQKDTPNRRSRAGDTEREAGNWRHGCKSSSKKGRAGDTEREA